MKIKVGYTVNNKSGKIIEMRFVVVDEEDIIGIAQEKCKDYRSISFSETNGDYENDFTIDRVIIDL